ncbi:TatD family hydrolase [uncultured Methanobrevibacter sp.]|uniref:TatD family hydrolase n=1 Tax=uncultured Methanobrevibacter sp. TaxID=253161 RepID=UPI0026258749|nr:TatD family hydrolase [uncultured Methanobrevibacter sp.]
MTGLIDIGLNLMHKSFDKNREEIIRNANDVGVSQFIITGTNIQSSKTALEFAKQDQFKGVLFSTAGVHPHDAKTCDGSTIETLREFAKEDCVVAIGECGLDYNRNYSPQDVQRKWFEEQVKLADELDMPLFLHEREAHEDLVKILEKYPNMCEKACVHCFTGTKVEAEKYLELGCSIGVTGWICDERRGQSLQEAVTVIPPEKMMIETDAPFLIPRNFPKKPKSNKNKPEYLPHILNTIAEYKGMDSEELGKKVSETTRKFFNI